MKKLPVLLLLLLTTLVYAQSSPPAKSESPICFTPSEYADFEAEVQAELERTALDAANEAVKPHLEYEAALIAEIKTVKESLKWWRAILLSTTITSTVAFMVTLAILQGMRHTLP